jgi:hypothetical protein
MLVEVINTVLDHVVNDWPFGSRVVNQDGLSTAATSRKRPSSYFPHGSFFLRVVTCPPSVTSYFGGSGLIIGTATGCAAGSAQAATANNRNMENLLATGFAV